MLNLWCICGFLYTKIYTYIVLYHVTIYYCLLFITTLILYGLIKRIAIQSTFSFFFYFFNYSFCFIYAAPTFEIFLN